MDKKYCVVGLGAMGMGMALNMIKNNLATYGIDLIAEKRRSFSQLGGKIDVDYGDIDVWVISLVSMEQINKLFFENNLVSSMKKHATVIVTSTVSIDDIKQLAANLAKHDIKTIDCPVSGGSSGAESGQLTLMLAGSHAEIESLDKFLQAISKKIVFVSENIGDGSLLKTLHQHIASIHVAATVELMALCRKAHFNEKLLYDVVTHSAGNSWMYEFFAPQIIENDFSPKSSVDIFEKDSRLVKNLATSLGIELKILNQVHAMFKEAKEEKLGNLSPMAMIKILEKSDSL